MYHTLRDLPSHYKPYPENTRIQYRPLTEGEVLNYSETDPEKIIDILTYFQEREVIKGIDLWDITPGDWQFIEISLMAVSFMLPLFTVESHIICEECTAKKLAENKQIEADYEKRMKVGQEVVPMTINRETQTFQHIYPSSPHMIDDTPIKLKAEITPGQMVWSEIADEVNGLPVIILYDNTKITMDYFRLKHLKEMKEKELEGVNKEIELLSKIKCEDTNRDDWQILETAYDIMEHGLSNKVLVNCPDCRKGEKEVVVDWNKDLTLLPFRRPDSEIRTRISFSGDTPPRHNVHEDNGQPPLREALRANGEQLEQEKPVSAAVQPPPPSPSPVKKKKRPVPPTQGYQSTPAAKFPPKYQKSKMSAR